MTQKQILEHIKSTKYSVLTFDKISGRRIASYVNINPLSALHEITRWQNSINSENVHIVPFLLPGKIDKLDITYEQAYELRIVAPNLR